MHSIVLGFEAFVIQLKVHQLHMKVAIVHYHLRRGGVSQVIQSAQNALRNSGTEVLIISGEAPGDGLNIDNLVVIPGLKYRKEAFQSITENLKQALKDAAQNHFGSQPDVWHFHNHSLGKNVLTPLLVTSLAEDKARLLLQLHDFPEDGRPKTISPSGASFIQKTNLFEPYIPRHHMFTMPRSIGGTVPFSEKRELNKIKFISFPIPCQV